VSVRTIMPPLSWRDRPRPSRMNAEFYERPPNEGEVVLGDVM
jgi:hypothetical protein